MIKVVWLCHLSNTQLKRHFDRENVNEFAPWISLLIDLLKNRNDLDIHIVAPNVFTNKDSCFFLDGINYHFYRYLPIPFYTKLFRKAHTFLNIQKLTNFYWIRRKICMIIDTINPDIIHLHGAENPYYSIGIIKYFKIKPTLVSIQGFVRNTHENSSVVSERVIVEEEILSKAKNIAIRASFMKNYLRRINPNVSFYWVQYPYKRPSIFTNIVKNSDVVFYGRICKDKGIEDLIHAIGMLYIWKKKVTLNVIGTISKNYSNYLKKIADDYGVWGNISFINFLPTQNDLHFHVAHSKICVLPTYDDIYSGTIVESMFMKIPVIAYKVDGLLDLDSPNNQTIILVEKGDIMGLAKSISNLLADTGMQNIISENAFNHVNNLFMEEEISISLMKSYKTIIDNFNI